MNKQKNDWLIIAIFVLICALTWVATNTYHSYVNKKEVVVKKELIAPLIPQIDQSLFEVLESRAYLEEEELVEILAGSTELGPIVPSPTPVELLEEIPIPSPIPTLSPTPTELLEETPTPTNQEI
ncbi:MAG: hypothetical protein PHX72_03395, partial [Candidatus Shapirobacteria bacterium]|nr:hypothetical protein [Candidatus Shapirobacteria bacterium]